MRLDARAFGTAAGITAAVLFTLCAAAVALVPGPTTTLASYLMHMELPQMSRSVTLGSFVVGLVVWTLGTAIVFGFAATIYNRLVTRAVATTRVTAGQPAPQAV